MAKYSVTINQKTVEVEVVDRRGSNIVLMIDGEQHQVDLAYIAPRVASHSGASSAPAFTPPAATQKQTVAKNVVASPMPGILVALKVKVGDSVTLGQTVAVIEAMKMENNVACAAAGKIKTVHVKAGQEVGANQPLVTLEA